MNALVRSYLFLRRGIGVLGFALPILMIAGKEVLQGGGLLGSLSGYYYSDMRNVFVGILCAMGVFLISYRGYGRVDDVAADIAAVAGIGVALFPTSPASPTGTEHAIGVAHLVFAAVFFLTLAFFCLFLFTKSDGAVLTPRKKARNALYRACGVVMLVSLALIVVVGFFFDDATASLHPTVWLESLAIFAFALAWLVKGETLLADLPRSRSAAAQPA
ncbi:DUF998 domain-containing protein [Amycolatopsis sp. PS_44_ISF1]|uniref:DUF998 domain-containing protein n=1 Tax=Amycolatopsis sp. PS_44_ISF1 TaxID=2974917 RepID=UPI0028E0116B|nr:DUF998 domain-containing protein [Amycolatopsis sp. PS_44_ISF1]MDT8911817.1 DUF998 domain-containing protein [Amycolatopsis sp. PS_44_ISF1]